MREKTTANTSASLCSGFEVSRGFTAISFCWNDSEPWKVWILLCKEIWGLCWSWSPLWVSLWGPAGISTFSALTNLILWDSCNFLASPESRVSLWYPHVRSEIRCGKPQLVVEMDRVVVAGYWGCSVCVWKLFPDFSSIPRCGELVLNADGGAQVLRGHSQEEEICPSLVQGLPFLFPRGGAAIHGEKTKGVGISDGSQVTLTRKCGHLS